MAKKSKKSAGKIFEEEIKACIPPEFFTERYKDDTAGFYGVTNPADYRLYKYPYTFLLELKTHKGKSIPVEKIRPNQIQGMYKACQYYGIFAGFLLNYRDLEETYYVSVGDLVEFINSTDRKSIPVEWCRSYGEKIEQEKKRVRYKYNLDAFFRGYYR